MEDDNGANIQELPTEVRSMIFRALPVEDVKRCRLTCPQWNADILADTPLMGRIYDTVSPSRAIKEALHGNLPFFNKLVQFATNKNPANQWGSTPLHWAANGGHIDICHLILDNVDIKNPVN